MMVKSVSLRSRYYLYILYIFLILGLSLADQLSKTWVLKNITASQQISIIPGLNLILRFNPGAAFGILSGHYTFKTYFFASIALVAVTWCCYRLWQLKNEFKCGLEIFSLILIASGAIGNSIDRLQHHFVIDFIDLYIQNWHWYTFNLADIFLCVGGICYFISTNYNKSSQ